MKAVLALSRVRPERGKELLPGLYNEEIDKHTIAVTNLFKSRGLKDSRYEYAKLLSMIVGLLYYEVPRTASNKISTPGTGLWVRGFFLSEEENVKLTKSKTKSLIETIGASANALQNEILAEIFDDKPFFFSKKGDGNWSQPVTVSLMVGFEFVYCAWRRYRCKIK